MFNDPIEAAAQIIAPANYVIAFTGAGMSAESGIPTFRDPGGVWDRFDPAEVGTPDGIMAFAIQNPEQMRDFLKESLATFEKAEPNPGHDGLAELEKMGLLKSVITQNIDDLHSIAGNTSVFEVHGNLYRFRCTSCQATQKFDREDILRKVNPVLSDASFSISGLLDVLPKCSCMGLMRPDVVMFGEAVLQMMESQVEAHKSDVILILGTSGIVYPAAGIPSEGKRTNSKIIEINPTENAFRGISDVYIQDSSAQAMPRIVKRVEALVPVL